MQSTRNLFWFCILNLFWCIYRLDLFYIRFNKPFLLIVPASNFGDFPLFFPHHPWSFFYLCHAFFKNCIHPWFATCVSIHNEICKFISRITWESNIELMYIFLISFQKLSFHLIFYTTGIFKFLIYFYIMENPMFFFKRPKKVI